MSKRATDRHGAWNHSGLRRIVAKAEAIRADRSRLRTLRTQHVTMVRYLRLRLEMQDWHGVRDAAADLEQIEARIAEVIAGRSEPSASES